MRDWLLHMVEERFNVLCMLFLLFTLISAHAFMVHANRAPEMIHWVEGMITGVFTGILGMLGAKQT
jgi:hypothetical protein